VGGDGMKAAETGTVVLDASEFEHAARKLAGAGFDDLAAKEVKRALIRSANVVRENVRKSARRHRRKGKLERGIHTTWKGAGLNFQLAVRSEGIEAHWIVRGVRPHRIPETGDRVMPIGENPRPFARVVHHPGFPPDPYVRRGVNASMPAIVSIVDATTKDIGAAVARLVKEK
jgi:hypothetical protein